MAEKITVCVWDDGTWCEKENIDQYVHMPDTYTNIKVDREHIEEAINAFLSI